MQYDMQNLWYNKSSNKHIFCNKRFKAFLECETSKDKPTPLLAIKTYPSDASSFLDIVIFQFFTSVTKSH